MSPSATQRYQTWLLLQDRANKHLENVIADWGLYDRISLERRPPVAVGCRGNGQAYLKSPEAERMFDELAVAGSIRAFSFAPEPELQALHGRVFFHHMRYIQVLWDGMNNLPIHNQDPYYRRFVTLRFLKSDPQAGLDNRQETAVESEYLGEEDALLVLRPERLTLKAERFRLMCLNQMKPLEGINGALLPPTRVEPEDGSYFSDRALKLRSSLAQVLEGGTPDADSAALAAWRLIDDPLVRDLLLDGGSLRVLGSDNDPTRLQLRIFHRGDRKRTGLDWLRAHAFLQPEKLPLPGWAVPVGAVLAADLRGIVHGQLTLAEAAEPCAWDADNRSEFDRGGPETGSWQLLNSLKKRLDDHHMVATLDDLVLWRTGRRPGANADHAQAERLFMLHVFRCPWRKEPPRAWRRAMLELMGETARDVLRGVTERMAAFDGLTVDLSVGEGSPSVVYSPLADAEEVLLWQLLCPLGTVFTSRSSVVLNRTAVLNQGYILA